MDRKIKFSDIEAAVAAAYEEMKGVTDGEVNPRVDTPAANFGISVVTTDGRVIEQGDARTPFIIGRIATIPVHIQLLGQLGSAEELVKKSGKMDCACANGTCAPDSKKARKATMRQAGMSAHIIRAVSAVEPTGDPEGKYGIIEGCIEAMMGDDPVMSDTFYKKQVEAAAAANVENVLTDTGYYLYDNAPIAIDLTAKLMALQATPVQLATMGATIAADGVNPVTRQEVFDGKISQSIVGMMAAKGPSKKMTVPWNVLAGLPAISGEGGAIVGVIPGVMAIAAASPALNRAGVPVKAARAIASIMRRLDISAFGSANIVID
ncbi:MAG: glutaminase [Muribaculaceae bacterium]|nr:glutaminase [Muribaculaceae bacterium]